MNTEQQRKAGNAQRRAVNLILKRSRKPDSSSSRRLRFEQLHDQWREVAGLPPVERIRTSRKPGGAAVCFICNTAITQP